MKSDEILFYNSFVCCKFLLCILSEQQRLNDVFAPASSISLFLKHWGVRQTSNADFSETSAVPNKMHFFILARTNFDTMFFFVTYACCFFGSRSTTCRVREVALPVCCSCLAYVPCLFFCLLLARFIFCIVEFCVPLRAALRCTRRRELHFIEDAVGVYFFSS